MKKESINFSGLNKRLENINFGETKFNLGSCNIDSLSVDKLIDKKYLCVTLSNGILILKVKNGVTLEYAFIDKGNLDTIFTKEGQHINSIECDNSKSLDEQLNEVCNYIKNK